MSALEHAATRRWRSRTGRLSFPPGFRLGSGHRRVPDRGRGRRGRPAAVHLGQVLPARPGKVAGGDTGDVAADHYHRYRRRRRADGATSACRRTGSRCPGRGSSPTGDGRGQRRAGWTSTTGSSTSCSPTGIEPVRHALPLGPAAGARGRAAAGRTGTPPTASPSTRRWWPRRLGDRVAHWTTLNEPWCSAFLGYARRARAGPHRAGRVARGGPPPAARPRPRGPGPARRAARDRAGLADAEPDVGTSGDRRRPRTAARCERIDGLHEPALPRPAAPGPLPGRRDRRSPADLTRLGLRARRRPGHDRAADRRARASTTTADRRRRGSSAGPAGRRHDSGGSCLPRLRRRRVRPAAGPARPAWAGRSTPAA